MGFSQAKTRVHPSLDMGGHWVYSTSAASVQPQPELHLYGLLRSWRITGQPPYGASPMEIPGLNATSVASQ